MMETVYAISFRSAGGGGARWRPEFPAGDSDLVEKMVAALALEYVVTVNSDPGYDCDEELVERILRFVG